MVWANRSGELERRSDLLTASPARRATHIIDRSEIHSNQTVRDPNTRGRHQHHPVPKPIRLIR